MQTFTSVFRAAVVLFCLLAGRSGIAQNITLPGGDGVVFQRAGVGQGAELELGINFGDAGLTQVQVYVEKYDINNNTSLYRNWTDYSCDAYPGASTDYRRVIIRLDDGRFRVKVRRKDNQQETPYRILGVGEVFYVAGQSNATGLPDVGIPSVLYPSLSAWVHFENNKDFSLVYLNPAKVQANCPSSPDYTYAFPAGANSNDPGASYVSYWYRLAEQLVQAWSVPVAIYQTGWADTGIADWETGALGNKVCRFWQNSVGNITTYPYRNLKQGFADRKFNGARAVLWLQGEKDSGVGSSSYVSSLRNVVSRSRTDAQSEMGTSVSLPWMIAQASRVSGSTYANITSAQSTVASDANNWLGPNVDAITSRKPDGTHFNEAGLVEIANKWFEKLNGGFVSSSTPIPAFGRSVSCTNPPAAPSVSPLSSSINAGGTQQLTASNCGGTVTWSTGQTGTTITVSPSQTTSYTATCKVGTCTSSASQSAVVNVGTVSSGCVTLDLASYYYDAGQPIKKRLALTYVNGTTPVLKLRDASSDASQIWKRDDVSGYVKLSRPDNTNQVIGVVGGGSSIGNEVELQSYSGGDAQMWSQSNSGVSCADCYIFYRKNTTNAFGSTKGSWGSGSGNASEQDFGLVSQSDALTFGMFKWVIKSAQCPTVCSNPPAAPTISPQSSTVALGNSQTLTASNCSGTVTWSNGQTGTSIMVYPTQTSYYSATCTVGTCTSAPSGTATVNVGAAQTTCTTLDLASYYHDANQTVKKRLAITYNNGSPVLKLRDASSDNSQIWRIETVGGYRKLSRLENSNLVIGVVGAGSSIGNEVELQTYTGSDAQLWDRNNTGTTCAGCYVFYRKGTTNAFGSTKGTWGSGSSNPAEQDFGLVSQSDALTFGMNKWVLNEFLCPTGGRLSSEITPRPELKVSPNPNKGVFKVAVTVTQKTTLTIADLMGRVRYEKSFHTPGTYDEEIHLDARGVLVVTQQSGDTLLSKRILIVD